MKLSYWLSAAVLGVSLGVAAPVASANPPAKRPGVNTQSVPARPSNHATPMVQPRYRPPAQVVPFNSLPRPRVHQPSNPVMRAATGPIVRRPRGEDYLTLSLGAGIPYTNWGGGGYVTRDRYGNWYVGGSGGYGLSQFPVSASLMTGRLNQPQIPTPRDVNSFLTGRAGNVSGGAIIGGGVTYSPGANRGVANSAREMGFITPQIGGSGSYGTDIHTNR